MTLRRDRVRTIMAITRTELLRGLIVFTILCGTLISEGLATSSAENREARKLFGGYRITPKFCNASKSLAGQTLRNRGPTICMFNHECSQRNGEVVGACMDGFLFGACCQLPGTVDSPLKTSSLPTTSSIAPSSYDDLNNLNSYGTKYGGSTLAPFGVSGYGPSSPSELDNSYGMAGDQTNNIFGSGSSATNTNGNKYNEFYVPNEAVMVSSPSSVDFNKNKLSSYYATASTASQAPESYSQAATQTYSPEVPSRITLSPFENYSGEAEGSTVQGDIVHSQYGVSALLQQSGGEFSHSDITHPGPDSVLVQASGTGAEDSYYAQPVDFYTSPHDEEKRTTTTRRPIKITYAKPAFKPRPTQSTYETDKYVLVHTISNERPTPAKPSNLETIESIILMLNDTKTGPQYDTDGMFTSNGYIESSTPVYTARPTAVPNSDKYGFYITTKTPTTPRPPSTSYVYSPSPSRRPAGKPEVNIYSTPVTQRPTKRVPTTTPAKPTTSYVLSTVAPNRRRPTTVAPPQTTLKVSTTTNPKKKVSASATRKPTTQNTGKPTRRPPNVRRPTTTPTPTIATTTTTTTRTPTPTRQAATSTTKAPATSYVTGTPSTTKLPLTKAPSKLPSTSYIFSPSPTRRPPFVTSAQTTGAATYTAVTETTPTVIIFNNYGNYADQQTDNIPPEYVVQSRPVAAQQATIPQNDYVKISSAPGTQRPSPTVHITPKPSGASSTTAQSSTPRPPSTSYVYSATVTKRPSFATSVTTNYRPAVTNSIDTSDFYRPTFNDYTETTNVPGYGQTGPYGGYQEYQPIEYSTVKDEYLTAQPDDLVNFPPVRNPNLNVSSSSGGGGYGNSPLEISTPGFAEDASLDDKMGLLVSKIVASLQGNFENLADLVDDRNNITSNDIAAVTVTTTRPITVKRPATTTRRPTTIGVKPSQRPGTARPGTATNAKPTRTTTIQPAVAANTKPPAAVRPGGATTKRPTAGTGANRVTTTTRKPANVQPSKKPPRKPAGTGATSTRRPLSKATTVTPTTRRPTKPTKKTQTTTTTTTVVVQDELIDEDGDTGDGGGGGDEEIGEETEYEGDDSTTYSPVDGRLQCGVRPHVKSGRIVGGKSATFAEFPWQVLVRESTWLGLFTKNKCGGVLISNNYVITAAHCQPGFLASLVAVFGEFDISGELESKRSVTKNVKRVIVHRQYDAATFENDLAMLELESPIRYDSHIVPVCMPADTADFTGRMATVTGWGRLKYGGGVPSVLQEVQVPIIENSVCQEMFHTAGHNKKILNSFLCAGYANGQKDSCEGDSGGPLVMQRADGRWELVGTVSHGIKCAAPYLPGVYMRTTFYKPWLHSIAGVH